MDSKEGAVGDGIDQKNIRSVSFPICRKRKREEEDTEEEGNEILDTANSNDERRPLCNEVHNKERFGICTSQVCIILTGKAMLAILGIAAYFSFRKR